jgi:hypothetical protein
MDLYNKINFKFISNQNCQILFYDCFARNKELILILPTYLKDLEIKTNEISLELKKEINEKDIILIYRFDFDFNQTYSIKLKFNQLNIDIDLNIYHIELPFTNDLYISTNFKNDIYLIPNWINHYKNLGFNKFIFYVNHPIDKIRILLDKAKKYILDKIKDINLTEDILFLEWNFEDEKISYKNHSLYKYAKPISYYFLNCKLNQLIILDEDYNLNDNITKLQLYNAKIKKKPIFEIVDIDFEITNKEEDFLYLFKPSYIDFYDIKNFNHEVNEKCKSIQI